MERAVLYSFTYDFQIYTKCRKTAVRFCFRDDDAFNDGIIEMELTLSYKSLCLLCLHRFNSYFNYFTLAPPGVQDVGSDEYKCGKFRFI